MPKVCAVTGKKTSTGNNRPWSKKATKRTFKANIQKKKVTIKGVTKTFLVSAKGLKTLKKRAKVQNK